MATTMATASEHTAAIHALTFRTPSSTNSVASGRTAKIALSASESPTGSSCCRYISSSLLLQGTVLLERVYGQVAQGRVEDLDGVGHGKSLRTREVAAAPSQRGRHLHEAAGVGGDQQLGSRSQHVPGLAVTQRSRRVGCQQVVDAGGAAA